MDRLSRAILKDEQQQAREIDREQLPEEWPIVYIPSKFWEEYGKTIGAFVAFEHTGKDFVKDLALWRDALCHGSWADYNEDIEVATLRHWRKKSWRQGGTSRCLSKDDLERIRRRVVSLIPNVTDKEWHPDHVPSEFWERYGRTVGCLTVLEDNLRRAIVKITATRRYIFQTDEQANDAFTVWDRSLGEMMSEPLGRLIGRITSAINDDDRYPAGIGAAMQQGLKNALEVRNKLVHGLWVSYDQSTGVATLRSLKGRECTLSMADLEKNRRMVRDRLIDVVNAVTLLGLRFPGEADNEVESDQQHADFQQHVTSAEGRVEG